MSANVPVPEHRDVEEFAQLVQEELELPDQIPQKGKVGQTARSYPVPKKTQMPESPLPVVARSQYCLLTPKRG